MSQVAEDITIYSAGRYLKDSEDIGEYLHACTNRRHINEFLRQVQVLVEDVHERGLHMMKL